MPAKFETNWMGGEDFTVGFAPRKSIRLRIWGSDVRIVPGAPPSQGSVPDTWVTFYSENIGNTFGPKGFARGSSLQVSSSKYPRS